MAEGPGLSTRQTNRESSAQTSQADRRLGTCQDWDPIRENRVAAESRGLLQGGSPVLIKGAPKPQLNSPARVQGTVTPPPHAQIHTLGGPA